MDICDDGSTSVNATEASIALSSLREHVFQQWTSRVTAAVPEAAELGEKVVTSALQRFFDEIIDTLRKTPDLPNETSQASVISLHARDRANSTAYGPRELLHELQLFRQSLFETADASGLRLAQQDRATIARTVDAGALEAMDAFALAHREISETFIACLAHDLRNPLNVANASAQLIQAKSIDDNVLRLARRVCAKLINVDEMIGTLLDAMAVNGRKKLRLKVTSFDMKSLVDEIAADMSLPDHPIISTGEASVGFWCRSSMRRAFENLLSNAQKYGAPRVPIKVHTEKSSEGLVLSVHNDGPAIPENEMHRLFSAFHRLADIDIKGWGLGLPLVQLVVESHGGTVGVSSTASVGTTFTIQLPIDCKACSSDFSEKN